MSKAASACAKAASACYDDSLFDLFDRDGVEARSLSTVVDCGRIRPVVVDWSSGEVRYTTGYDIGQLLLDRWVQ